MTSTNRDPTPPIVHALGGSIGSALALLLFYPLERARIEMQSKVGTSSAPKLASTKLVDKGEISPIRCANDSHLSNKDDEASWDVDVGSPTSASWSMNSGSSGDDGNTTSSFPGDEDSIVSNDIDDSSEGILRCLLDLRERKVLYKGVKPIISTIFTRYVK